MFKVPKESPIHVHTTNMCATSSTKFELPSYIVELAHHFAEAPSPPPTRTCPFNNIVLGFLDIEAEQGEDNDRHNNPSSLLGLVVLETQACILCFI